MQVNRNLIELYGVEVLQQAGVEMINTQQDWDSKTLGYPESDQSSKLQYTLDNCKKLQTFLQNDGGEYVWPEKIDAASYDNQQLPPMETPAESTMGKENIPGNNPVEQQGKASDTKTGGRKKKKRKTRRKKKKSYLKKSRKRKMRKSKR